MAFFKSNEFYDWKVIRKALITILLVFAAMKVSGGAAFVAVIPFTLMAVFTNRVEKMLFWVMFTNMLVVTNDFFVPKGFIFAAGFRLLLTSVGMYGVLQFFSVRSSKFVLPLLGIFAYLFYMIIPSLQGWAPMVACMKLVLFGTTYMALAFISTKAQATKNFDVRKFRSMMLAFCVVFLVGSVLLIPFPGISMLNAEELLRNGSVGTSLFKGMTNHSQTMGVMICCMMTFLLADMFFTVQRKDKLYILLLVCGLILIGRTSSRTAMGSLLAIVMFLAYNMMQARGVKASWKSKVVSTITVIVVMAAAAVVMIPSARAKFVKTAMKYGGDESVASFDMEKAVSSRMGLVDYSLYLWRLKPTIGWGFQVSPEIGEKERKSGGLLLTAPVEKGVWVTAMLEEGGVFGEIIYCTYALFAFIMLLSKRAYMGVTIFLTIHISNLGEFTMFSMSGVGCVWYTVMFAALIFDAKRMQKPKMPGWGMGFRPSPLVPRFRV